MLPIDGWDRSLVDWMQAPGVDPDDFGVRVYPNWITAEQEAELVKVCDARMKKRKYEKGHWDGVIFGFREALVPLATMPVVVKPALDKVVEHMLGGEKPMKDAHVLDLHQEGAILPHVDMVQAFGAHITAISLLSPAVARFHECATVATPEKPATYSGRIVTALLPARSLYVMVYVQGHARVGRVADVGMQTRGDARYQWAHEILKGTVMFKDQPIARGRRISVLLRSQLTRPASSSSSPPLPPPPQSMSYSSTNPSA